MVARAEHKLVLDVDEGDSLYCPDGRDQG